MARRFFYLDVDFFHKNTCHVLTDELGQGGPLMWIALIAQCKNHRPAGEFTWTSEADAFEQLFGGSILPDELPFTFEEFLRITGRLKQTRRAKTDRRRRGRVANVALTGWEHWQKESRTWSERERKSRKRGISDADTLRTEGGHAADMPRTKSASSSRTSSTPKPPKENQNGNTPHPLGREWHRHDCPTCGARQPSKSALEDHVRIFHDLQPADDDIPF